MIRTYNITKKEWVLKGETVLYGTLDKAHNKEVNCTLEELIILQIIVNEPAITQKELARKSGKSERTIKRKTVELQDKGYMRRLNGKRNGRGEVLINLPLK